jgi:carbamoyltransferase
MKSPDGHQFEPHCFYFNNHRNYADFVARSVLAGKLVNTVTGAMEFGPRALCNTSTLALPSASNVTAINSLNGRDTVMPMAPVMLAANAYQFFNHKDYDRVVGSLEHMILTLDYHSTIDVNRFRGVMHPYPDKTRFSGRPQFVHSGDEPIHQILTDVKHEWPALINTSFNVHGVPIVFSLNHALDDMRYNSTQAEEFCLPQPLLVIGNFEDS